MDQFDPWQVVPRHIFTPYSRLLISAAFADVSGFGCLGVTGVSIISKLQHTFFFNREIDLNDQHLSMIKYLCLHSLSFTLDFIKVFGICLTNKNKYILKNNEMEGVTFIYKYCIYVFYACTVHTAVLFIKYLNVP